MSLNKINNKKKRDFIPFENEFWKYQIDTNSRKKCCIIEVNWEKFPISKDLLNTFIIMSRNKYNDYELNLDIIWINNCIIKATTTEYLIIWILQELVKLIQKNEISTIELKQTIIKVRKESHLILESIYD
jgi:hypothetical protein